MHYLLADAAIRRVMVGGVFILRRRAAGWRLTAVIEGKRRFRAGGKPDVDVGLSKKALAGEGKEGEERQQQARVRRARDARNRFLPTPDGHPRHISPLR
jgi:hypothetical protein